MLNRMLFEITLVVPFLTSFVYAAEQAKACVDWNKELDSISKELHECGFKDQDMFDEEKFDAAYECALQRKGVMKDHETLIVANLEEHYRPFILKNQKEIMDIMDKCSENKATVLRKIFDPCFKEEFVKICPIDEQEDEAAAEQL